MTGSSISADWTRVLETAPSAEAYTGRGVCELTLARYKDALGDIDKALSVRPDHAEAEYRRGHAHQALGETAAALADFTAAAAHSPGLAGAHLGRGLILYGRGDLKTAVAALTDAIQLDATLVDAFFTRGLALQSQGRIEDAIADYTRALSLDKKNMLARTYRGGAYVQKGDYAKAVADLNDCDTNDPDVYRPLALAFTMLGKPGEAYGYYSKDCEYKAPKDAEACFWAGAHCLKHSDWYGAQGYFKAYLKLRPDDAEAKRLYQAAVAGGDREAKEWADAYYAKKEAEQPRGVGLSMVLIQSALGIAAAVNSTGGGSSSYSGSGPGYQSGSYTSGSGAAPAAPDMSARTRQANEQVRKNIEKKLWDMSNPYRR